MIKHVGRHGDRKVAIIFREVPGEEHMCLLVYTETLPVAMHDALMRAIETPASQTAENLGDALFRELFSDGRPMLQTLHAEGMLKKVQTRQVVVTPNPSSHVNLEELNDILRKMKLGEAAVREMADIDNNKGLAKCVHAMTLVAKLARPPKPCVPAVPRSQVLMLPVPWMMWR